MVTDYLPGQPSPGMRPMGTGLTALPGTQRLLRMAGIRLGMRALDLRCGSGGVTALLAHVVGSSGSVTGLDTSAESLTLAERKTEAAGLFWVNFTQASVEELPTGQVFDAAVGYLVLFRQPDPVAFLRSAARQVRAGGVLGFHQVTASPGDAAGDLARLFRSAGLPEPDLCFESGGRRDPPGQGRRYFAVTRTC